MSDKVLPYQPQFSDWRPPAEIPDHNGQPIPESAEFFQTPPVEIGQLVTAHSSLRLGKQHVPLLIKLLLITGIPAVVAVMTWQVAQLARRGSDEEMFIYFVGCVNLNQGQFQIHHKDARWLSRKGKFNFPYATMANARLFLLAMQKLTGYHFG